MTWRAHIRGGRTTPRLRNEAPRDAPTSADNERVPIAIVAATMTEMIASVGTRLANKAREARTPVDDAE